MNLFAKFSLGLTYEDFLSRYANDNQKQRWRQVHAQVALTEAQRQLLGAFTRSMNVLCLAGAWCGDCINQCPIFEHFAAAAPPTLGPVSNSRTTPCSGTCNPKRAFP